MANIWHIPNFIPDPFKSHPIIVIYEAGGEIEQMMSNEYRTRVGDRYVNRWCYVDDLLNCEEALEIAVGALKSAQRYICSDKKSYQIIQTAIEQIIALTKGGYNE